MHQYSACICSILITATRQSVQSQRTQNCSVFKTHSLGLSQTVTVTLVLFCLLVVEDTVEETTIQIKGSWRFCPSVHKSQKHFGHSFGLKCFA